MTADGHLLSPSELAAEIAKKPGEYEIYCSESSFANYEKLYEVLRLPTLVVYGSADELVPTIRSRAVIEPILLRLKTDYEIKVFEGADHEIKMPDGHVRQDYLDLIVAWSKAKFHIVQ